MHTNVINEQPAVGFQSMLEIGSKQEYEFATTHNLVKQLNRSNSKQTENSLL